VGILAGDLLNGACFRGLRTAVLGRIPALLSSDEFRSSVERKAQVKRYGESQEGC
jgi:hypothetical protein